MQSLWPSGRARILSAQARFPGQEGRGLDGRGAGPDPGPASTSSCEPSRVLGTPTILRASGERGSQRGQETSFEVGPSV